jgi:hypothetical protein
VRATALVAAAPALWVLMDVLVTGDPLYSLHVTDSASEEFYGQYSAWENLEAAGRNMLWYLGVFPLLAIGPAAVLLVRDRSRAALAPLGALGLTLAVFLLLLSQGIASSERYLFVPVCVLTILAATAVDGGGRRTPRRVLVGVFLAVFLCVHVASRTDVYGTTAKDAAVLHGLDDSSRALVGMPGVREALRNCPAVSLPTGLMRHWFAFYGGRAPESFISDGTGRVHPDLYVAPGNPAVVKLVLTRPRFDDDASYRVPPGLRRGPRNADWMLYVSGTSACTRGLR